ncbi:hypothetical protein L596_006444 [Steinernema carpocapsae]|uniref:Uncharacterized protein n=1 Tax=Steinernema carpocapsae TaxID=34508 RepID=A0A4U8V263_STECR|nr:hypothetical protein L596_006444 [Steinernema carpocapsae]
MFAQENVRDSSSTDCRRASKALSLPSVSEWCPCSNLLFIICCLFIYRFFCHRRRLQPLQTQRIPGGTGVAVLPKLPASFRLITPLPSIEGPSFNFCICL